MVIGVGSELAAELAAELGRETGSAPGRIGTVLNGGKNRVVQARTVRKDGWTEARRAGFLLALSMTANVTISAQGVGITRSGANALRRREPAFAALWAEALASGYDRLEEALLAATLAALQGDGAGGAGGPDAAGRDASGGDAASGDGGRAVGIAADEIVPGSGIMRLESVQAVQVGLAMLARYRAAEAGGGRKTGKHRRATVAETNASIAKKLDSLAQRLRASSGEEDA
ncbi:MAG TPA: hypothetical protein VNJ10_13020 [Sphingomonas sp.]|nr:hypothetical protein [Sphingomonas sp.]